MIDDATRAVLQRVSFVGDHTYQRTGPAVHAPMVFSDAEDVTARGIHRALSNMSMRPGEVVAMWDLAADEHRPFAEVVQDLPPVPSRLMVRTVERRLLELNPGYISINNRPDGWKDLSVDEY